MGRNIGKNIPKNLRGKCTLKFLDRAKQSALKTTSKRATQKPAEATGDLITNKTSDNITKVSKNSQQNISETVTNEHDKETPKEKYEKKIRRKAGNY